MESSRFYFSQHEQAFAEWARSEGWTVTKQGWPDFICRRGDQVMAVEVKGGNDGLRSEQIDAIGDLQRAGLPTFLWTPETGLTIPVEGEVTESIQSLRMERAALIRMLREAYTTSMELKRAYRGRFRGRYLTPEAQGLLEVQEMCHARHSGHRAKLPEENLGVCAWLVKMSEHLTVAQMAEIVSMEVELVQATLEYALAHRARFLKRITPIPADAA